MEQPGIRAVALLALVVATACTGNAYLQVPANRIDLPANYKYRNVTWFPDGKQMFYVGIENDPDAFGYVLYGEHEPAILAIQPEFACRRIDYPWSAALPDGRLGVILRCYDRWPDRPPSLGDESYLFAYDLDTNQYEQIVPGPLPSANLSRHFTWNPDMTRGIQEFRSLDGTLYWIGPDGPEAMIVTVSDSRRSWSLDENYVAIRDRLDLNATGVARVPAWSPDGTRIAFFATLDSIGRDDMRRTSGEWRLYIMDSVILDPTSELEGIYEPAIMYWSPDGEWLAFLGRAGRARQSGLWLFSPADAGLQLAAEGSFGSLAWSPDGQVIAAVKCTDDFCQQTEVWQYDVGQIVKGPSQ